MSYILDALKKSEQERRRGEMPEITRFETSEDNSKSRRQYLPIVIITLLSLNVVAVVIWAPWKSDERTAVPVSSTYQEPVKRPTQVEPSVQPKSQKQAIVREDIEPARHTVGFTAKAEQASQPNVATPAQKRTTPQSTATEVIQPAATKRREVVATKPAQEPEIIRPRTQQPETYVAPVLTSYLPQLQELPASIQSRVPDMSFSSHMYSSQPRYRSIIINGRRLKEGQFLNDDIQVREITDKGVILGLDGTVFEVDVLGQWVN